MRTTGHQIIQDLTNNAFRGFLQEAKFPRKPFGRPSGLFGLAGLAGLLIAAVVIYFVGIWFRDEGE
jgi:hypothetical protein